MDGYCFKQIIFENLKYEISIEIAIYVYGLVPFLTKNNINKAFNARLEIIYVHSYDKYALKILKCNLIFLKKKNF